ncbi:MAG: hypothetical protein OXU98_06645 [Gammaproteobacteria bacterium]|nr:hypothetical protein [Gammaproteobacteria bacterium]
MIPGALHEVAAALTASNLQLPSGSGDARRDSSSAENALVAWLQNERRWDIHSPNIAAGHNREWYDLSIDGHYCDIKVSELKSFDNTNAKNAVYYFLTGNADRAPVQWAEFFEDMAQRENPSEERDFYFIVVSKPRADAFIVSLKGIGEIKPAHNNPPFQCNWSLCRTPVNRDWHQARQYLLSVWAETVKKGIETYQRGMPTHFPEFFQCR